MSSKWIAVVSLSALAVAACSGDDELPMLATSASAGTAGTQMATGGTGTSAGAGGASAGQSGSGGAAGAPSPFCPNAASTIAYDPAKGDITIFPDDFWTVDDPTSMTGKRVHIVAGDNFNLPKTGTMFAGVFGDLSLLDGFGTTSGMEIRFATTMDPTSLPPSGDGSNTPSASVLLVDLDASPPVLLNTETAFFPEDDDDPTSTLIVTASVPLRPKAHYGLAVTNRVHDMNGGCVAPSPVMASLLDGSATDPKLAPLVPRYEDLIQKLTSLGAITSATELTAASVFTTQHTFDDSLAIATDIRAKGGVTYTSLGPCTADPSGKFRVCEGLMASHDYRVDHHYVDESSLTAHDAWQVPVTTYLPMTPSKGPLPTIIFGHGLGGSRHQAQDLAVFSGPKNLAVVAIDAVKHGDHPDHPANQSDKLSAIAAFFGFDLTTATLDSRALRDNFRESTYDKLQVVEMLRPGLDIDGDGTKDVGVDQLMHLGVSLGGIMSSEFLAFAPDNVLAIPIVPGARVTDIIQFSKTFSPIILLAKGSASLGDVTRAFPFVQTAIDRGDSGAYTPHILHDRFPGFDARVPQLLMQMVVNDDTVPNVCNDYFARGLDVPLVGDELVHVGTVAHEPKLPTMGNWDATHTAGLFQYDVVWDDSTGPCPPCDLSTGKLQPATHGNVGANEITIDQTFTFVDSYLSSGLPIIIDPYRDYGVKK